jgi:hypothetical protein
VTVRDVTVEQAMDRLLGALAQAKAAALRREGSTVEFRGGVFRIVSSWNVLVPISNGVVEVSPNAHGVSVSYRVTFGQMLAVVTLMVGAFLGPPLMAAPNVSVVGGLGLLAVAWAWLFGGNFVLTRWRLPAFLVRALSSPAA